jgi:dipeptidyl aminopeptidase/acylaminoacyl peptidase
LRADFADDEVGGELVVRVQIRMETDAGCERTERGVGGTAVPDLLGGSPDEVPERYDWADPIARVPLPVPVVCVHSRADESVPIGQSEAYVAAARAAGGAAELVEFDGDHMAHVDPTSTAWAAVVAALPQFLNS